MKRFRALTIGALVTGLLVTGVALAQGPRGGGQGRGPGGRGGPGGFGGPGGLGLPLATLNLTDAQRDQLRTIRERNRDQGRAAGERLREAFDAQRKAAQAIPSNEGEIRSTTQALADAQTEVAIQLSNLRSEVWSILTPAQQDQMKKVQAEREARMAERRARMQERQRQQQAR